MQTLGTVVSRLGNRSRFAAPEGIYPALGDDQWLAISVENDAQWHNLRKVLGDPDWARDPALASFEGRMAHHDEIDAHLSSWTLTRDRYAAMKTLLTVGVPAGALQRSSDLAEDPQYILRKFHRFHEHPVMGRVPYAGVQFLIPGYEAGPYRFAPLLGEHTDAILSEALGMSADQILETRESGALR